MIVNRHRTRNLSIIAHVDHGKTTLTDALLGGSGNLVTDTTKEERERGISIKSTGISLEYTVKNPAESVGRYLMNIIDSPGHVDFSGEVTAALRLTDGALVVIDCIEGVCVQTETVLSQALQEKIKPVLTVNKLDRAFLELNLDSEIMYQRFTNSIASANAIVGDLQDELVDWTFSPQKGSVAFSSGLQGWGFTLHTFARMYSKKFGISEDKMVKRLWGDNFFDPSTRKWSKSPIVDGRKLERGFCKFIIDPIRKVFEMCKDMDFEQLEKVLASFSVSLTREEKETVVEPKKLMKLVLNRWLSCKDALMEMIAGHLPSPIDAQKYRVSSLYTGPQDDETAEAIRNCDPDGPLCLYVAKMVPNAEKTRFYAFGRVFSGTLKSGSGQRVQILGNNFNRETKEDYFDNVTIQSAAVMMGNKMIAKPTIEAGNTCCIDKVDKMIVKSATITTAVDPHPIVDMKFSVSPVVRMAVEPKKTSDLPKFVEGLKKLAKSEPMIQVSVSPQGEHILAGVGELHLGVCITSLKEDFLPPSMEVITTDPIVELRETVLETSSECFARSPNNHNRFWATASPMDKELVDCLVKGGSIKVDKEMEKTLFNQFGFEQSHAKRVWRVGPEESYTNMVVDTTKGVQYLTEVKDSFAAAFEWIGREGALCEEPLYGVRFDLTDATLHADAIHRGGGQIIPAARKLMLGAMLSSKPVILEPIYLITITCPVSVMGNVHTLAHKTRGTLVNDLELQSTLHELSFHIPVVESFGFSEKLKGCTHGKGFCQMSFSHWSVVPGDPFEEGTKSYELVKATRKRKGLNVDILPPEHYLDKNIK